jgi:uncharacterized protein with HEPN domain
MDKDIRTWLYDIVQAINEIESYYQKQPKIFEEYIADTRTKRAIERDLEIIGEAVNRIVKKNHDFRIENADKIIGTRNRIIHGYDKVSDDLIWSIVINHLPKLKDEIQRLLNVL